MDSDQLNVYFKNIAIDKVYADYSAGTITLEEAQKQIAALSGKAEKQPAIKYWTDKNGELYKINPETNQVELVNIPQDKFEQDLSDGIKAMQLKKLSNEEIYQRLFSEYPLEVTTLLNLFGVF